MRELKPCGTPAAYRRHLRHGEAPCEECKEAARAQSREAKREARGVNTSRVTDSLDDSLVSNVGEGFILEGLEENLRFIKAAMLVAVPREAAALSKRKQELEQAIWDEVSKSRKSRVSAIDELAARRRERLRKAVGG